MELTLKEVRMADYLYKSIENLFEEIDKPDIPNSITENLKHPLRDYQVEALTNFIYYNEFSKNIRIFPINTCCFIWQPGAVRRRL